MILNTTKAEAETLPNLRKAAILLVALGEGSSARTAAATQRRRSPEGQPRGRQD